MAFWKAAFAALSLFAAVEGFTTPTVSRVSQPPRMTATLAESDLGITATENLRNIAGAYDNRLTEIDSVLRRYMLLLRCL